MAGEPDEDEQVFLDAPWELLADQHGAWATRDAMQWCLVRRLGRRTYPPSPAPHRLCAVFMAAAPEGLGDREQLQFESEEAAILRATDPWT